MTDTSTHVERLRLLFREEAKEYFEAIHRALGEVDSEDQASRERALSAALRAAHSIKGGAAIAGLSVLQTLIHNWESSVAALAKQGAGVDQPTKDLLIRALDVASDELERRSGGTRSEEHTSELQSQFHLVCRLLLEKKK